MVQITQTTDVNKTKDEKTLCFCSQCHGETNHVVMQSIDSAWQDDDGISGTDNYQIIQCQGCNTVTFRHVNRFSEDGGFVSETEWDDGSTVRLYPKRSNQTRPIKDYFNAPNLLRRIYRETLECFNNDSVTLCAAGLRGIIEGICLDQKITDGPVPGKEKDGTPKRSKDLYGKIAGLGEKGILTEQYAEILHEHRLLGNDAIHELHQPSHDELALAIDIIEHTLDELYEIQDKSDRIKSIRTKK
jgi:hypothetical protein